MFFKNEKRVVIFFWDTVQVMKKYHEPMKEKYFRCIIHMILNIIEFYFH